MYVTVTRVDACKIGLPRSFNVKSNGAGVMTNRKHVERETAKPARELAAAELECVSGGTKAGSHQASCVMFLTFTFKLVAVKTV
jgi:hypothetical protein